MITHQLLHVLLGQEGLHQVHEQVPNTTQVSGKRGCIDGSRVLLQELQRLHR